MNELLSLLFLAMMVGFGYCDESDSCQQDSKLIQNGDTICQIDYQHCFDNNSFQIQLCVGYRCRLQVSGQCYYYSYQALNESRCMRECCSSTITYQQDYSTLLEQCLQVKTYSQNTDVQQLPSNKTAIILACILGAVFLAIISACICCRHRIKQFIMPEQPPSANVVRPEASIAQIDNTEINFSINPNTMQIHYEKQEQCTICLNSSNDIRTQCGHWFHFECLTSWLVKNYRCPNCMNEKINPITAFCRKCRKPYVQVKLGRNKEARHLKNSLNSFKCHECKNIN